MTWDRRRQLYLVTDRRRTCGRDVVDLCRVAVGAAPDRIAVQVREKDLNARELLDLAARIVAVCRAAAVPVLVNDRADVALAAGADGVHLPTSGMPLAEARSLFPQPRIVGVSCHSADEPLSATAADFAVVGPVFDTPSKRPFGPPLGLDVLERAVRSSPVPVVAIGGIRQDNAASVARAGCAGIACVGAIWEADDPGRAVRDLLVAFDTGREP